MRRNESERIDMFLDELAVLERKYNVIITHADENGVEVEYLPYWQHRQKVKKFIKDFSDLIGNNK